MKRCVIFAAVPLGNIKNIDIDKDDYVICADAGIKAALKLGIKPDLALGDFDSCDKALCDGIVSISFPVRKDDTDLMLAVKYGLEVGCDEFCIYGALGGERLDHTIAAFSALAFLKDNGADGTLFDDKTCVKILDVGEHKIENFGGYLSLFPFGCDRVSVYLKGTAYDGESMLMSSFPLGVSNEILEEFATVTVFQSETESRVLMIQTKKD